MREDIAKLEQFMRTLNNDLLCVLSSVYRHSKELVKENEELVKENRELKKRIKSLSKSNGSNQKSIT